MPPTPPLARYSRALLWLKGVEVGGNGALAPASGSAEERRIKDLLREVSAELEDATGRVLGRRRAAKVTYIAQASGTPMQAVPDGPFFGTPGGSGQSMTITAIDTAAESLTVAGDQTAYLPADSVFTITGSTALNGLWVVVSSTYNSGPVTTTIVVDGNVVTSATPGTITVADTLTSVAVDGSDITSDLTLIDDGWTIYRAGSTFTVGATLLITGKPGYDTTGWDTLAETGLFGVPDDIEMAVLDQLVVKYDRLYRLASPLTQSITLAGGTTILRTPKYDYCESFRSCIARYRRATRG